MWISQCQRRRDAVNLTDKGLEKGQVTGEVEETQYSTMKYNHSYGSWRGLEI